MTLHQLPELEQPAELLRRLPAIASTAALSRTDQVGDGAFHERTVRHPGEPLRDQVGRILESHQDRAVLERDGRGQRCGPVGLHGGEDGTGWAGAAMEGM